MEWESKKQFNKGKKIVALVSQLVGQKKVELKAIVLNPTCICHFTRSLTSLDNLTSNWPEITSNLAQPSTI